MLPSVLQRLFLCGCAELQKTVEYEQANIKTHEIWSGKSECVASGCKNCFLGMPSFIISWLYSNQSTMSGPKRPTEFFFQKGNKQQLKVKHEESMTDARQTNEMAFVYFAASVAVVP